MNAFLQWLWPATLAGSAAIVLTLLLMPLLRRLLGAQPAFPAWVFTLGLLVSPWELRSPASVLPPASDLPPIVVQVFIPYHSSPPVPQTTAPQDRPFPWLFAIWAGGAAGLFALAAIRFLRTHRLVRGSRNITPDLQELLAAIGGLPRRARVHESTEIGSPAMCGVFRPVILLPTGWASEKDLRWILLHEIGHIRRGDLAWRWVFQVARVIHWFNPLVWLAERAARIDQEMACDEWVLARGEETGRTDYGEAILRAARRPSGRWFMQAGMAESRSGLTRRIRHLALTHPRGFWTVIVTLFLGASALFFLSPGTHPPTTPEPSVTETKPSLPTPPLAQAPTPAAAATPRPASPSGPPTQIEIESLFVEVDPATAEEVFGSENQQTILQPGEAQQLIRRLVGRKGSELLSAPKVITKSGRKAIVNIVRELAYPTEFTPPETRDAKPGQPYRIPATPTAFEVRNVGITLEVTPQITRDNRIISELKPAAVEFLGFVNYGAGAPGKTAASDDMLDAALRPVANTSDVINQPIFRKREVQTTVILRSGQTAVLGGLARRDMQSANSIVGFPSGFPPQQGVKEIERVLFVFVTTRLLNSGGIFVSAEEAATAPPAPAPKPSPTPSPNSPAASGGQPEPVVTIRPASGNVAYGNPVPGKPGFVISPWAPDKGHVDVRGFPKDTEVKCPYTGQIFLVP
jgi:beta-lactamase regulating signal transducer with metallopeptidase domain